MKIHGRQEVDSETRKQLTSIEKKLDKLDKKLDNHIDEICFSSSSSIFSNFIEFAY